MGRMDFRERVVLGRTGLSVSRLGLGSSYGVGADALERAYGEYGINYFYWGSVRRPSFGEGIRRLAARHRDDLVVVIQTYSRFTAWVPRSLERALGALALDRADLFLLGMFNRPPKPAIMDVVRKLKDDGKVRFLAVSCHRRSTFAQYVREGVFDVVMFRYSAAHRGAEAEVLPLLTWDSRPGTVAYTATRWGQLLDPSRMPPGEQPPRASDCYRYVLSQPQIDVCLTGSKDDEQLREALSALDRGPMGPEEIAWMRGIGDHVHRQPASRNPLRRMMQAGS